MAVPDSDRFLCYDCRHEFVPENVVTPLRIFLSYGHDDNEELVRLIKTDLELRGNDVWFDKSRIKAGDDWRRAITEGIADSDKVISFLSRHSTRDPGVCLDEIAIAVGVKGGNIQTVLVEGEREVNAPATISHIQWLDMHDWKEHRAAGEEVWRKYYELKLLEIIRVVESSETRRFAGEIQTLSGLLRPLSSDARIGQLLQRGFVGRQWLVDSIDAWRNQANRQSRLFWLTGLPGVGKSAFAAHLAHFGRDRVLAVHFCEYDKPDHRNPAQIVRTIAFQLSTRLPDYRKLLLTLPEIHALDSKNASELFDYLLSEPLAKVICGGRERYLIVIDALDEAEGRSGNELAEMLARSAPRLPPWIGIVVTSRPESRVAAPLQELKPTALQATSVENRRDMEAYLRATLGRQLASRANSADLVSQMVEKSEGIFLYAERLCEDVLQGHVSLDSSAEFPQGLGGVFFGYFRRKFPDIAAYRREVRPMLRAILAAREPLTVEDLRQIIGGDLEGTLDRVRALGTLFPMTLDGGRQVMKPYHRSLYEWLADGTRSHEYFVSVDEGHRLLAEYYSRRFPFGDNRREGALREGRWSDADGRMLIALPYHLAATRNHRAAIELCVNSDYLRAIMHVDRIPDYVGQCQSLEQVFPDGGRWDAAEIRLWSQLTVARRLMARREQVPGDEEIALMMQVGRREMAVRCVKNRRASHDQLSGIFEIGKALLRSGESADDLIDYALDLFQLVKGERENSIAAGQLASLLLSADRPIEAESFLGAMRTMCLDNIRPDESYLFTPPFELLIKSGHHATVTRLLHEMFPYLDGGPVPPEHEKSVKKKVALLRLEAANFNTDELTPSEASFIDSTDLSIIDFLQSATASKDLRILAAALGRRREPRDTTLAGWVALAIKFDLTYRSEIPWSGSHDQGGLIAIAGSLAAAIHSRCAPADLVESLLREALDRCRSVSEVRNRETCLIRILGRALECRLTDLAHFIRRNLAVFSPNPDVDTVRIMDGLIDPEELPTAVKGLRLAASDGSLAEHYRAGVCSLLALGRYDQALFFARNSLTNRYNVQDATVAEVATAMAKDGRLDEAITVALSISNDYCRSLSLQAIIREKCQSTHVGQLFSLLTKMSYRDVRLQTKRDLCATLIESGRRNEADEMLDSLLADLLGEDAPGMMAKSLAKLGGVFAKANGRPAAKLCFDAAVAYARRVRHDQLRTRVLRDVALERTEAGDASEVVAIASLIVDKSLVSIPLSPSDMSEERDLIFMTNEWMDALADIAAALACKRRFTEATEVAHHIKGHYFRSTKVEEESLERVRAAVANGAATPKSGKLDPLATVKECAVELSIQGPEFRSIAKAAAPLAEDWRSDDGTWSPRRRGTDSRRVQTLNRLAEAVASLGEFGMAERLVGNCDETHLLFLLASWQSALDSVSVGLAVQTLVDATRIAGVFNAHWNEISRSLATCDRSFDCV